MKLAWIALALALLGADDPAPEKQAPRSGSAPAEVKPGSPGAQSQAYAKAATDRPATPGPERHHQPPPAAKANEVLEEWPLSLPVAILIALDDSEIVRRVYQFPAAFVDDEPGRDPSSLVTPKYVLPVGNCFGPRVTTTQVAGPIMISRVDAGMSPWRFRAEVMELVRAVEQRYWVFAYQHAWVGITEQVVKSAREIMKKKLSESPHNRGPVADIALPEQRLRGFQNDLVLQTRLMIIAERRLRSILGLPESDNRRLVPTTRPLEDGVSYDWDECQQEMLRKHPDLVRVKLEMEPQASRTAAPLPITKDGTTAIVTTTDAQVGEADKILRQDEVQNAIAAATARLRRSLSELDANYKQYQIAKRCLSIASAQRQERERAYNEGRIG